MYNFRKIKSNNIDFKQVQHDNSFFLSLFTDYCKEITRMSKNAIDDKSGSASSYTSSLIKLGVIINEKYKKNILFDSTFFYNELENIRNDINYFKYNNDLEGRFPNAAINRYYDFISFMALRDDEVNDVIIENKRYNVKKIDEDRKIVKQSITSEYYPRLKKERDISMERANYMCEYDKSHKTFISMATGKQYVESHHLIPMSFQPFFEKSIDVEPNIIVLCPNCHRLFHHGVSKDKKDIIRYFFELRKNDISRSIKDISFEVLLKYYSV